MQIIYTVYPEWVYRVNVNIYFLRVYSNKVRHYSVREAYLALKMTTSVRQVSQSNLKQQCQCNHHQMQHLTNSGCLYM